MRTKHKTRRSHDQLIRRVAIDALEPRRMLAFVFGTGADDTIIISASGANTNVSVNGNVTSSGDSSMLIMAGEGNDTIIVNSTRSGTSVEVRGENGFDSFMNGNHDFDSFLLGSVTFDGGAGSDILFADNVFDSTTPATIDISNQSIRKNGNDTLLAFSHIEEFVYFDNDGSNRIGFFSLNFSGQSVDVLEATIIGNDGNDTFANTASTLPGSGFWPTSVPEFGIVLDGGPGTDTVLVDNHNDTGGTYVVNADTIDVNSPSSDTGLLKYLNCESIDALSTPSNDSVFLNAKPATTTLRFDSSDGNDTFSLGGGDLDSNGWGLTTLIAGNGTDSIHFDDHLNTSGELYTFNNFTLAAGTGGMTYSAFETQTLDLANGALPAEFDPTNNVNINAISGQITSTTITGGISHVQLVNVGNGNLTNVSGSLTVNLSYRPVNMLSINDQSGTGTTSSFEVNNIQVLKTSTAQTINYSGVGVMTLNTRDSSTIGDVVNVKSTPSGMSLTVNSLSGNDNLFFGNGNIDANLLGPITLNAGTGTDFGGISNNLDATVETITLNATSLIDGGLTHTFTGFEGTINVNLGPGGTNLTINGTQTNTNVLATFGSNDTYTVGGGDIDANFAATVAKGLFIEDQGGINTLRLNDLNDTNLDQYIFQQASGLDQFVKRDGTNENFITWTGMSAVTLDASNAPTEPLTDSDITVFNVNTPLRINGNAGSDNIAIGDAGAPVIVNTGLGDFDSLDVNFDTGAGDAPATVLIERSDDLEQLIIEVGGTLRIGPGATVVKTRDRSPTGFLFIRGTLDLAGGAFLSRAGGPISLAAFRDLIIAGRNGGAWNGTSASGAINSSLANTSALADSVGYGLGSEIAPTSIGGFSIAAADTLVRYTLDGDANLDQTVNVNDFTRLAANFGQTGRSWTQGDFTYDGTANINDFTRMASNFGQSVAGLDAFARSPISGINGSDKLRDLLAGLT